MNATKTPLPADSLPLPEPFLRGEAHLLLAIDRAYKAGFLGFAGALRELYKRDFGSGLKSVGGSDFMGAS